MRQHKVNPKELPPKSEPALWKPPPVPSHTPPTIFPTDKLSSDILHKRSVLPIFDPDNK